MKDLRTAAIVGGGIAGPTAALALRKAGVEATIYEAYPSTADHIGGSIALAPNGIEALDIVGVKDAVLAFGQPVSRMAMAVGRKRIDLPHLSDVGPMQQVNRGRLYRALNDHALSQGVRVEYGKRLIGVDEAPDGAVVRFDDGDSATADIVVGADGIHSTVRGLIDPDAPGARHTGLLGFEGNADVDVDAASGASDAMTFAFGKRGYYLYWPTPGGGTTWGVNLPQDRPLSLVEARATPADEWMRRLRDVYGEDTPGGELMRHTDPERLQVVGSLYIMPSVPRWHRGRMVLVGDSVHAPSNSSGQGASLAIESAIQLARCLRDLPDLSTAFAAYERLRRPRVERVAARAAGINRAKAPGPVARALMPVLMPLLVKAAMNPEKTIGPEQRYRIDWDAPVAADPVPA